MSRLIEREYRHFGGMTAALDFSSRAPAPRTMPVVRLRGAGKWVALSVEPISAGIRHTPSGSLTLPFVMCSNMESAD